MIIAYHEDDKAGLEGANMLFDKEVENSFYLTGGIKDFLEEFPNYVTGSHVPFIIPKQSPASPKKFLLKQSCYRLSEYTTFKSKLPAIHHSKVSENSENSPSNPTQFFSPVTKNSRKNTTSQRNSLAGFLPSIKKTKACTLFSLKKKKEAEVTEKPNNIIMSPKDKTAEILKRKINTLKQKGDECFLKPNEFWPYGQLANIQENQENESEACKKS